ncbi:hypothetical protein R0J93_25375, partial [Pseudoalteromonas sp. SIMBA_148]
MKIRLASRCTRPWSDIPQLQGMMVKLSLDESGLDESELDEAGLYESALDQSGLDSGAEATHCADGACQA